MEESLEDECLLHLLDDNFDEDFVRKVEKQDDLLGIDELIDVINDDSEDRVSKNFNDETTSKIQEEMAELQEKLKSLKQKLNQTNCDKNVLVKSDQKQTNQTRCLEKDVQEELRNSSLLPLTKPEVVSVERQGQKAADLVQKSPANQKAIASNRMMQKPRVLVDVPLNLHEESTLQNRKTLTANRNKNNILEKDNLVHTGLTDSSDDEMNRNCLESNRLSEEGRKLKRRLAHSPKFNEKFPIKKQAWRRNSSEVLQAGKSNVCEENEIDVFSGIQLINPLVSSTEMKSKMSGRKLLRLSLLETYVRSGNIDGDWVTVGVLIQKSDPKKSNKTGKTFSIWTLNDLRILNKSVNLFLFGEVHHTHWKTSVGSVVGILNASVLPNRDGYSENLAISVDHPGKVLMMGTSKDFGHCKARKKDGRSCTMVVNVSLCSYCEYHVQTEYKKMSGRRMELQTMSGVHPKSLKSQILQKQAVFYGGELYTCPRPEPVKKKRTKDKLIIESLKLQSKAQVFQQDARPKKSLAHLSAKENCTISSISTSSEFLSEKLCEPTAGSRNLLKHLVKEDDSGKASKRNFKSITPKELLKMHAQSLQSRQKPVTAGGSFTPQLGRGFKPGDNISFNLGAVTPRRAANTSDVAKFRAAAKLQGKGQIKRDNPNAVKKILSPDVQDKIQKRVVEGMQESGEGSKNCQENGEPPLKKNRLADVDVASERFQKILQRKSSHAHEVNEEEAERQEKYFHTLERKETMEQKMESITELKCDVVSCSTCQYTAQQPADLCLVEQHPLKRHKAFKRFFECCDCRRRTCCFTRIPSKSCKSCGGSNFKRTTMMKPKQGPKLDSEKLLIRGDEAKFI